MPFHLVPIPGPLVLVPTKSLNGKIRQQLRDHPRLPAGLQHLAADLNQRAQGVAATFDRPRGGGSWSLLLHGETYVARLFLSGRQDAYTIGALRPLRIRDHHRIAQGCLMVRPTAWHLVFEHREIPPNSQSHWSTLGQAWQRLDAGYVERRGAPPRSEAQTRFLDTVDRLIDASERINEQSATSTQPYPYRSVAATGGERHGTRAIYDFRLADGRRPDEGAFVQVKGEPEQRGQVTRAQGASVTIRFDDPVDWKAIPRQGDLEVTFSSVVYAKQREAVQLLRSRQEHGPSLLPTLVEHQVRPIRPVADAPTERLDERSGQLDAFRRALSVEDMLLVLGPPGTGKTRTISQIAGGVALRADSGSGNGNGPVLITSHTNRAVDNVLPRLPRGLWVVRVGNDGRVTEEGRPYLLETQATQLRQTILNDTGRRKGSYDSIDTAIRAAGFLDTRLDRLATLLDAEARARGELDATRRSAGGPAQLRVTELQAQRQDLAAALDAAGQRLARLARRRDATARRTRWWLIGPLLTLLVRRHDRRLAAESEQVMGLHGDDARLRSELDTAERYLEAVTRDHPAVRQARDAVASAQRESAACRADAFTAARSCRAAVPPADGAVPPPPVREDADPQTADRDLAELRSWLGQWLPILAARGRLLDEWHQAVSEETRQLHPELIRYAHVIAATSVGVGSRPELAGVDFDLAIVDEAGQIGVADVLVPLVRARRAVLVGDHQQLPPFLDSEVEAWGRGLNDHAIIELLSRSALETMVDALPETHVVPLTVQRRMPAVIADFASASFYDGKLLTSDDVSRDHRDPLFHSPMAFIDTARLPERERYEKSGRANENWGQRGYTNPTEARMLVRLAQLYHGRGVEWAVIVPYRAQSALINAQLTRLIGNPELVALNVGTVDSFQGGERDVILYGFTRSNPGGDIGFLKELRRLNVALTRAKHQLVLVGDMDTLTNARDAPLRDLAVNLRAYLAEHGDIRQYGEVRDHLISLRDESVPS